MLKEKDAPRGRSWKSLVQGWSVRSAIFVLGAVMAFSVADVANAQEASSAAATAEVGADHGEKDEPAPVPTKTFATMSTQSRTCATCHAKENPGLYQQWGNSKHFGANVGCYECHKAEEGDPDAIRHKDHLISVIVSPKDCAQCHATEVAEFDASHHATGGLIIGSLDNFLAEVVEGTTHGPMALNGESPAAVQGCWACHGSPVTVLPDGKLDSATWPNTGIGRLNPDGTKGACTACHQRHEFSLVQARRPEACGKCHLGPDHPQKEIYEESKHGIAFYSAPVEKMNMDSPKWIPGQDYTAAPTCATCHMSATADLPITHDIGARISWNLRPPISAKTDEIEKKKGKENPKPWLERRADMKNVCRSCHQTNWVENWYDQYDSVVHLYNGKFGKPGAEIMAALLENDLRTKTAFDDEIEWTWFYLWHHEGRRVRHGAAMMAPDYVQWHGFYEIAERFYIELIPQARELIEHGKEHGKTEGAEKVEAVIAEILDRPEHQWFSGKTPPGKETLDAKRKAFMEKFNAMDPYGNGGGAH